MTSTAHADRVLSGAANRRRWRRCRGPSYPHPRRLLCANDRTIRINRFSTMPNSLRPGEQRLSIDVLLAPCFDDGADASGDAALQASFRAHTFIAATIRRLVSAGVFSPYLYPTNPPTDAHARRPPLPARCVAIPTKKPGSGARYSFPLRTQFSRHRILSHRVSCCHPDSDHPKSSSKPTALTVLPMKPVGVDGINLFHARKDLRDKCTLFSHHFDNVTSGPV